MEEAERTELSAELMTAAETAPRPKKETAVGVRYCSTIGRIMRMSSSGIPPSAVRFPAYVVLLQSKWGNTICVGKTIS